MRKNVWLVLGVGLTLASGRTALADVWDVQTQNDNTVASENELVNGSDQMHDLGALPGPVADTDFYRISQKPFSSYEIVVDATSGDIGTGLIVQRTDAVGAPLQPSVAVGVGYSRSLRWMNTTTAAEDNTQRISVASGSCTTNCGADDVYRLRSYETTYAVPRFNNSATQVTVLLLQNPTNYTISGTVFFWSAAGVASGNAPFSLAPKALFVLNTASVAPGVSGALTISNDGRYGDLSGKTVALEPATGFSFDTPALPRVH